MYKCQNCIQVLNFLPEIGVPSHNPGSIFTKGMGMVPFVQISTVELSAVPLAKYL
jgi:hypothetical protein